MSDPQRNTEVFRGYLAAVSGGEVDVDVLDETLAEDVVHHELPGGRPPGREGMKEQQLSMGATFADRQIEIEDTVAEGDRVAARLTLSARHVGEFSGIEATGVPRDLLGERHPWALRNLLRSGLGGRSGDTPAAPMLNLAFF